MPAKPARTPSRDRTAPHYRRGPQAGWTKTRRLAYERLLASANELSAEAEAPFLFLRETVPEAWDTLEADVDVWEKKTKVTLMLDDSVAKFYRAQGAGYQARINRILATYAQMKIAEVREAEAAYERFKEEERG
ncbi:BrnA antitoxin family protein [Pseudoruegeria sp. SK021]|uniref:BrnA antitoxin family protein n=1 Tax=Pseudoruegeria sp. SK021 TaxID=1933035 RepID=UPI000A2525ED|nr:BrnA antitoxin family protein [Pseudoruegeria sp. SK021]OSP55100.1 hypothetical protein BV911_08695 [Pseudoruegeria sp. SK021]